jgi:Na+/phosphate symporter
MYKNEVYRIICDGGKNEIEITCPSKHYDFIKRLAYTLNHSILDYEIFKQIEINKYEQSPLNVWSFTLDYIKMEIIEIFDYVESVIDIKSIIRKNKIDIIINE